MSDPQLPRAPEAHPRGLPACSHGPVEPQGRRGCWGPRGSTSGPHAEPGRPEAGGPRAWVSPPGPLPLPASQGLCFTSSNGSFSFLPFPTEHVEPLVSASKAQSQPLQRKGHEPSADNPERTTPGCPETLGCAWPRHSPGSLRGLRANIPDPLSEDRAETKTRAGRLVVGTTHKPGWGALGQRHSYLQKEEPPAVVVCSIAERRKFSETENSGGT